MSKKKKRKYKAMHSSIKNKPTAKFDIDDNWSSDDDNQDNKILDTNKSKVNSNEWLARRKQNIELIKQGKNPFLDYYHSTLSTIFHDDVSVLDKYDIFDENISEELRDKLFQRINMNIALDYAWCIPNEKALKICSTFSPIIEIGCGSAYIGGLLTYQYNVEYIGFDKKVPKLPFISNIGKGSAEQILKYSNHTLMLSYPDENPNDSLALKCLDNYQGQYIILFGERFPNTKLQNPWGKSISPYFQEKLCETFHLILEIELPNFLYPMIHYQFGKEHH